MQQPTCVFAAHDPERDSFCILLEDLYSLNLDSGEALSELNAVQEGLTPLPDLGLYSEQFRTLARFNGSPTRSDAIETCLVESSRNSPNQSSSSV